MEDPFEGLSPEVRTLLVAMLNDPGPIAGKEWTREQLDECVSRMQDELDLIEGRMRQLLDQQENCLLVMKRAFEALLVRDFSDSPTRPSTP